MSPMQRLFVTCTFLILIAIGGAYAGFSSGISRINGLAASAAESDRMLTARISELESTVLLLARDTADIRSGQETYAQTQNVEKQALSQALQKLTVSVSTQGSELSTLSKTSDISSLIAAWSPFVYDITCRFDKGGVESKSSGSATVEWFEGKVRFLTNSHVVETPGEALVSCELSRPGSKETYTIPAERVLISEEHDAAYGTLAETPSAMLRSRRCGTVPTIGDGVVILGYPQIGAKESVTATEGIISGFDEEYYTTSAKIEKGNSGGAAIDVERDCFLGLPTLVFAGKIESLARILPVASLE
jgi:S1-C subfamily serine protease